MVSSSVARWLKLVLASSGIDTSIFSAHSTRGASTSAASLAGVTTQQILSTADWSTANVFKKFYFRDRQVQSPCQGFNLSVLSASKSRDKEPKASDMLTMHEKDDSVTSSLGWGPLKVSRVGRCDTPPSPSSYNFAPSSYNFE